MANVSEILGRLAPWPQVDFAAFGEIEILPLSRHQKLTGAFLGRNWVTIPHVTYHDDIDISEMESRRVAWNEEHPSSKLTSVILLLKALPKVLALFPHFNASLSEDGVSLILKKYFNIGLAVDTPKGLLVPVISGCNSKSLAELADEAARIAEKARTKGLTIAEMSGSSMAISSLGHIGGTAFTPIINAPDVAILGVTRAKQAPVPGADRGIIWRTMLPLSLSYDHRVINGADAARFLRVLGEVLGAAELFT